jgi:hypothetical protein
MDMRKMVLFLIPFLLLHGLVFPQTTKVASSAEEQKLVSYLNSHWKSPEEYVMSKFAQYDLVLIGEPHWVRQHVVLVSGLIPRLHKRGVNILAIEFARRIDQPLIDSLLNAAVYDEKLARRITMQSQVQWGYQEYVDLYKAAWQINRNLPRGSPRFRILALEGSPDWSVIKKREDMDNVQVRRSVFHGETEKDWATLLIDRVLAKKQKALVYSGMHHAFTKYAQPIVSDGALVRKEDSRFGQYLHAYAPTRIFMIALHGPWPGSAGYNAPPVLPADGVLDQALESTGRKWNRVGFDLDGTPFGELVSETAVYKHGYEPFTLEEFADGYVYVGPISKYEAVTPIPDFINEGNIEYARANSANPSDRTASIADFNKGIASSLEVRKRRWREAGKR